MLGAEVPESNWRCVPGSPTTAPAPLNKGEKPSPSLGTCAGKVKTKVKTYQCCSNSQSLKKSNRSIAARRYRRAGVGHCLRQVGAALSSADSPALLHSRTFKSARTALAVAAGT